MTPNHFHLLSDSGSVRKCVSSLKLMTQAEPRLVHISLIFAKLGIGWRKIPLSSCCSRRTSIKNPSQVESRRPSIHSKILFPESVRTGRLLPTPHHSCSHTNKRPHSFFKVIAHLFPFWLWPRRVVVLAFIIYMLYWPCYVILAFIYLS